MSDPQLTLSKQRAHERLEKRGGEPKRLAGLLDVVLARHDPRRRAREAEREGISKFNAASSRIARRAG